jgi:hypothetical protein
MGKSVPKINFTCLVDQAVGSEHSWLGPPETISSYENVEAWVRLAAAGQTTRETQFLVALPSASHVPVADADNLRCLPPGDLLGHGSQNYFLYFHR